MSAIELLVKEFSEALPAHKVDLAIRHLKALLALLEEYRSRM